MLESFPIGDDVEEVGLGEAKDPTTTVILVCPVQVSVVLGCATVDWSVFSKSINGRLTF